MQDAVHMPPLHAPHRQSKTEVPITYKSLHALAALCTQEQCHACLLAAQ